MFATGFPIGTSPRGPSRSHRHHVTSTAASVGPYKLSSRAPGSRPRHRCASSYGSASPLQITCRTVPHPSTPGSARNTCSIDGTKCSTVIRSRWIVSTRYAGSRCPPGRASTSVAPVISGQNSSHTETSKLIGVFCSTRSPAVSPYVACIHCSRLQIPRCVFIAPFGRPVDPDV